MIPTNSFQPRMYKLADNRAKTILKYKLIKIYIYVLYNKY